MDVTRHNIHEAFGLFTSELARCDFYALDEEMTGISAMRGKDPEFESPIGDPELAYRVGRRVAAKYHVTQVGITLFKAKSENKKSNESASGAWEARTFNFHVIPQTRGTDLVINADTAGFLRRNSFDFNSWLDNGIPYVIKSQKGTDRRKGKDGPREKKSDSKKGEIQPPTTVSAKSSESPSPATLELVGSVPSDDNQDAPSIQIGFKSVYQAIVASKKPIVGHNCFNDLLFLTSSFGTYTPTHLGKVNASAQKEYKAQRLERQEGPGKRLGQPSSDLPEDYLEYKRWLRSEFPLIFDTKRICAELPPSTFSTIKGGSSLAGLYNYFKDQVKVEKVPLPNLNSPAFISPAMNQPLAEGSSSHTNITELAHHAGYDAYMTGIVFLALKQQLGDSSKMEWLEEIAASIDAESGRLQHGKSLFERQFGNQVAIFRSVYRFHVSETRDGYIPSFGAAVLKLDQDKIAQDLGTEKAVKDGSTTSMKESISIPERLDNDLIVGCVREMLPPKQALKTKDSDIRYYRMSKASAVVMLPENATMSLQPRPYVQAKLFLPVEQRATGQHPDPFLGKKMATSVVHASKANPSSGFFRTLLRSVFGKK